MIEKNCVEKSLVRRRKLRKIADNKNTRKWKNRLEMSNLLPGRMFDRERCFSATGWEGSKE